MITMNTNPGGRNRVTMVHGPALSMEGSLGLPKGDNGEFGLLQGNKLRAEGDERGQAGERRPPRDVPSADGE